MLGTVRRKAGINVQGNLMVPAVSQHVWNGEKEMQERTEGPYGPQSACLKQ